MVKQRKNGGKPRNGVPWWRKLVLPRRGVKDSRLRPAMDTPEQMVKLEKYGMGRIVSYADIAAFLRATFVRLSVLIVLFLLFSSESVRGGW